MNLKRNFINLGFFVMTMFFICSCAKKEPFRIGFSTWVGYGPFYVAQEKGFFAEEGLNVELIRMEGTGEKRAALLSKRLEGLGSTVDDYIVGISQGLNGKMVLFIDESYGGDGVLVKSNIKTIKDFAGKRIGVQPGFVNHFFLLHLLDIGNLNQDNVKIVPMEPDQAAIALLKDNIDIAVTWEPHLSLIKNRKDYNLFITTRDKLAQKIIVDNLIIRDDVLKNRSKEVEKLIKVWFKTIQFIEQNREDSYKIIAKFFKLKQEEVSNMLSGARFMSLEENRNFFDTRRNPNVYSICEKALKLYQKSKIISNLNKLRQKSDWVDTVPINKAFNL